MDVEAVDEEMLEPSWELDGFADEEEREKHMVRLVDDLLDESTRAWKDIKQRWMQADKRLEPDSGMEIIGAGSGTSRSDLPFVPQAIEEAIAVMVESLPRPQVLPRQAKQEQFTSALNYFVGEELDANDFDLIMARCALDIKRFCLGIIKQSVDRYAKGPFGQSGKIMLSRVDPRHIWPDPLSATWAECRYVIEARPMDLSTIREMFPDKGMQVHSESTYSLSRNDIGDAEPQTGGGIEFDSGYVIGERQRALVKELWLNDDQKHEVPVLDGNGNPSFDDDGNAITRLEKRYPNGRLVITANKVLLLDIANPFRHGQRPYSFFPGRVSAKLLTYGDVEVLGRIEDKINQLQKDMMRNARVNMNSPWIIDQHAFDSPKKFKNVTHDPGLVLPVRPGARVMRLPPAELPQFIFPLVDYLKGVFDDVLGIQSISRGQLEKGAQLSAEAIQSLQGTATSRIRLKSRLLENGLKHLGHLLQWNIRQFYPAGMTAEIDDPSNPGSKHEISWSDEAAQADFAVAIQAGSSLPGAKQSMTQMALTLWDHGLIGPKRTLSMMDLPGVDEAVQERQQLLEQLAKVNLEAAIKEATGTTNKTSRAGRKDKMSTV